MFCVQYFHVYETQVGFCITDDTLILTGYRHLGDLFTLNDTFFAGSTQIHDMLVSADTSSDQTCQS